MARDGTNCENAHAVRAAISETDSTRSEETQRPRTLTQFARETPTSITCTVRIYSFEAKQPTV